jgi:hypothetical protein
MASVSNRFGSARRLPGLSWAERAGAERAGRRDGRRGLPQVPAGLTPQGRLPPAVPDYTELLRAQVAEAAACCHEQIFREGSRLAVEVFQAAGAVVARQRAAASPEAGGPRLRHALSVWTALCKVHGAAIKAAEHRADQRMTCYWNAVRHHHSDLRAISAERRSRLVTLWSQPGHPVREVAADLAEWSPERIRLDPAWPEPLELLRQWAVTRSDSDAYHYGVLVEALELLNIPA